MTDPETIKEQLRIYDEMMALLASVDLSARRRARKMLQAAGAEPSEIMSWTWEERAFFVATGATPRFRHSGSGRIAIVTGRVPSKEESEKAWERHRTQRTRTALMSAVKHWVNDLMEPHVTRAPSNPHLNTRMIKAVARLLGFPLPPVSVEGLFVYAKQLHADIQLRRLLVLPLIEKPGDPHVREFMHGLYHQGRGVGFFMVFHASYDLPHPHAGTRWCGARLEETLREEETA